MSTPHQNLEQVKSLPVQRASQAVALKPRFGSKRVDGLFSMRTFIIVVLGGTLFASFLSPQIGMLGRGLRTSLPLMVLLAGAIWLLRSRIIRLHLGDFIFPVLLGLFFIGTGLFRNLLDPQIDTFHNFVTNAIISITVFIAMILVRRVFPAALEGVRWIVLLTLGISLGAGIPILLLNPGIAKTTMGNPLAAVNAALLAPRGVGEYSIYISVGFAFPVIANWLYTNKSRWLMKLFGWFLLLVAAAATLFSTFTEAFVLLVIGALIWLILVLFSGGRKLSRWIAGIILVGVFIIFPTLYSISLSSSATAASITKATRIISTTISQGALVGDETGRVRRLVDTMQTFYRDPILGAWGIEPNFYYGGHSSWADMLALNGIVGLFLWLGFLWPSWRRGRRPLSVLSGAAGGTVAWILFAVGGILDPVFFVQAGLILLWLFDDGGIWKQVSSNTQDGKRE